jgi:hypothetical protein
MPPQSMSVSFWFFTPSLHVGAAHAPLGLHTPDSGQSDALVHAIGGPPVEASLPPPVEPMAPPVVVVPPLDPAEPPVVTTVAS